MMWFILGWIALGLATGWLNSRGRYGGVGDWVVALLLPPVMALIALIEVADIRDGIQWRRARRLAERERQIAERERQIENDYHETLRLIEWRPRELTAIERLEEELETLQTDPVSWRSGNL